MGASVAMCRSTTVSETRVIGATQTAQTATREARGMRRRSALSVAPPMLTLFGIFPTSPFKLRPPGMLTYTDWWQPYLTSRAGRVAIKVRTVAAPCVAAASV